MAARLPKAVLCLVSALDWHGLTTQVPREVQIALPVGARSPRPRFPPIRAFWFSPRAYRAGIEQHAADGVTVRVYGVACCTAFRDPAIAIASSSKGPPCSRRGQGPRIVHRAMPPGSRARPMRASPAKHVASKEAGGESGVTLGAYGPPDGDRDTDQSI